MNNPLLLRPTFWLILAIAGLSYRCSSDTPDASVTDSGSGGNDAGTADQGVADTGGGGMDATVTDTGGNSDAGPADAGGDNNEDFDTAVLVPLDATLSPPFIIEHAGDRDFYKLELTAGTWVRVFTLNPGMILDTVIRFYDPQRTLIAQNDDALPRVDTNSEVIFHVPTTGTYYAEVLDFGDWTNDMPMGSTNHRYQIKAQLLDPAAIANLITDPETGDNAASAADLEFTNGAGFLFGTLRDASDVDVYNFSITGAAGETFTADFMPAGVMGYGSTSPAGQIWITGANSSTIAARIDQSVEYSNIQPPLAAGAYHLWIKHPGGTAGTNDFYVVKMGISGDNPPETMEAGNNTRAGAEPIDVTTVAPRSGFVLATLATGDVDYYSFAAGAGDMITIVCGSQTSGSGVMGLHIELVDGADTVLAMDDEMAPAENAAIEDFAVTAAATHFLRVSKTGQSAEVLGNWVRCGVHLAP